MPRLLVHIVTGPENPTRVALGLLVARTALANGHTVDVFMASDGVSVLRPETLDAGQGVGTGSFRDHMDALVEGGATLYGSAMSSKARGIGSDALGGLPVSLVQPDKLVELVFQADRILVY
jgi:predicted peroxiredoxin